MITAVPVQSNEANARISGHFGSAPFFALIGDQGAVSFLDRRGAESCAPVDELLSAGVTSVIAVGMGRGAMHRLEEAGISTRFITEGPEHLADFVSVLAGDYVNGGMQLSKDAGICTGGGSQERTQTGGGSPEHHHHDHGDSHHHGDSECCHEHGQDECHHGLTDAHHHHGSQGCGCGGHH